MANLSNFDGDLLISATDKTAVVAVSNIIVDTMRKWEYGFYAYPEKVSEKDVYFSRDDFFKGKKSTSLNIKRPSPVTVTAGGNSATTSNHLAAGWLKNLKGQKDSKFLNKTPLLCSLLARISNQVVACMTALQELCFTRRGRP